MPGLPADTLLALPDRPSHWLRCGWFWAWAIVGGAGTLGFIVFGTPGLLPALIAGYLIAGSRAGRGSAFGLLAGAGLVLLFIAYLQRQGPGTTCWHTATAAGCNQHLDPRPWLVVGLLMLVGAVVAQSRRRR